MKEFSPNTRQINKDFIFGLVKDALKDTKFLYCEEHGHTYSILSEKKKLIVQVEYDYDVCSGEEYILHRYKNLAFDTRFGFRIVLDRSTKKSFLKALRDLQNRGRDTVQTYKSFRESYFKSLDSGLKALVDDYDTSVKKPVQKNISFADLVDDICDFEDYSKSLL